MSSSGTSIDDDVETDSKVRRGGGGSDWTMMQGRWIGGHCFFGGATVVNAASAPSQHPVTPCKALEDIEHVLAGVKWFSSLR
jgi:hypothetical protein